MRSVSVIESIFVFTFSTAVAVSSAKASKAVVFTPAVEAISVLACVLMRAKSAVLVRSNVSLEAALVFTTSTIEFRAAV